jgi:hypothetical protein
MWRKIVTPHCHYSCPQGKMNPTNLKQCSYNIGSLQYAPVVHFCALFLTGQSLQQLSSSSTTRVWFPIETFLFVTTQKPILGTTQPPIQYELKAHHPGSKRPESEADHSTHLLPMLRMRGVIPPFAHNSLWLSIQTSPLTSITTTLQLTYLTSKLCSHYVCNF